MTRGQPNNVLSPKPSSHSANPSTSSAVSSVGSIFFLPQYMHVTDPSYISLDAANAIVSSYPAPETTRHLISKDIIVTHVALRTINMFLDYILHEFLARAKATSLLRLREAVALVIRTTLGTAAMVEAEQELAAYLNDSETELYAQGDEDAEWDYNDNTSWNLEKVWARARIKCMIYSTLGDKEEDDFDEETEEEADYDIPASKRKLSPAGAIYLTAVLEFIGEHCFLVSARTAYHRLGTQLRTNEANQTELVPLTIEGTDVKRGIAEDDLTTRIWRKWKRSEKLVATMSTIASKHRTESSEHYDVNMSPEKLNKLPFTAPEMTKDGIASADLRRPISIRSAPDLFREDPNTAERKNHSSLPISPTRNSHGQIRRQRSRTNSDAGTRRQTVSVMDIKETLGERGVALPESPKMEEARPSDRVTSPKSDDRRRSSIKDEICEKEDEVIDDPLQTPTPRSQEEHVEEKKKVKPEVEEDVYIMGGEAGLDVYPPL
jgi:hypothetical protein